MVMVLVEKEMGLGGVVFSGNPTLKDVIRSSQRPFRKIWEQEAPHQGRQALQVSFSG